MTENTTSEQLLYFNGIDGSTGEYSLPPMTGEKLSGFIKGEAKPENLDELRFRSRKEAHFGLAEGIDPRDLAASGWGAIFPHDADPEIKEALTDLLELRREQAGERFKIYEKGDGYRPGESKTKFTSRHGAAPGPVDPDRMPYYLLIIGGPEAIPFEFQYQLDVQFAVGRIHFETPQEYANYAASVKKVETEEVKLPRRMSFFGVSNRDDKATSLSAEHLVTPLFNRLQSDQADWDMTTFVNDQATKDQLSRLLGGDQKPALLFTASHGMAFPEGDSRQIPHQGALLCQDWPGPKEWREAIPENFYFAGDDISADAGLLGLLAFHFACYGAGTPLYDEFSKQAFKKRESIAPHPFVAGLPAKMLGHPKGGALAVAGHVERAWGYSFLWPGVAPQTTVFESALKRLLEGHPIGSAFEYFDDRYAELASDLCMELEEIEYGKQVNPYELAGMWTANNDARGYVIIGDPAVRLPAAEPGEAVIERPEIEIQQFKEAPSEDSAPVDPAPVGAAPVDFGLLDIGKNVSNSFKNMARKMAELMSDTVEDLTSLEVSTYTSDDIEKSEYDSKTGKFSEGARLRAHTRIELDGDMVNLIPERKKSDGESRPEIDEQLWGIHREMVDLAQTNRTAFIKALAEAAGSLIKTSK